MGFEDSDTVKDGAGAGAGDGKVSVVSCSICFDDVCDNGERAWAKLLCGHLFHLDCIGSAFNIKGAMQCPNCRTIEKGQWLCATDSRSSISPEFNVYDEDLYDLGYNDRSFGAHWYPFTGLARHSSSLNVGEISSPPPYHDLVGQHARFGEQTSVSSPPYPCPYVAYLEPYQHSPSNSTRNVPESSNLNSHWNGPPAEMATSYAFPATDDLEYYSWAQHFTVTPMPPVTQSSRRVTSGIQRSGSVMHSFHVGHSAGVRAISAVASSALPPNAGSNARTRDRSQALHAYHQQLSPNNAPTIHAPMNSHTRRSRPRSVSQPSNQTGGFYFYPSSPNYRNREISLASHYPPWESEHLPSFPNQQLSGGSDSGVRPNNYQQEYGLN